jgi:hypothetical protein
MDPLNVIPPSKETVETVVSNVNIGAWFLALFGGLAAIFGRTMAFLGKRTVAQFDAKLTDYDRRLAVVEKEKLDTKVADDHAKRITLLEREKQDAGLAASQRAELRADFQQHRDETRLNFNQVFDLLRLIDEKLYEINKRIPKADA